MSYIILKKVGKIGGDDRQIRSRLKHVLKCIDKGVQFEVTDVRVRGTASSSRPPIYEVCLDDAEAAEDLRRAFGRFTRKKNPVRRPPELDGVEVSNSVTLATRVRISVLRVSFLFLASLVLGSVTLVLALLFCRFKFELFLCH